ncbi:DNA binding protein [Vibrio phage vB_VpS_PG07]|uniref:Uncharacterized protein n=1 Tax=Vibrio phage vB_VpS_PG07 TaxID=2301664 RepID=A0A385E7D1_9CAUD|nr:DNA binding protein [Vibrio phage vB_VpS_PG07]AXQ66772.1 hypothetical protein [Vibrio phage vB_VpS_PG07]
MTKQTVAGFEWNKETESQATTLYRELVAEVGLETANTNVELGKIAKAVGAKSAQSVRSKLSTLKDEEGEPVYQKAAKARSVRGKVKTQKIHYIRALQNLATANGVEVTGRKFESLEQAVGSDLELIVELAEALSGKQVIVNPDDTQADEEAKVPRQETAKA